MKEIDSLLKRARKYLESAELLINSGDYESAASRSDFVISEEDAKNMLANGRMFVEEISKQSMA